MKKILTLLIIIIILLITAGAAYWYYLLYVPSGEVTVTTTGGETTNNGFMPLGGQNNTGGTNTGNNSTSNAGSQNNSGNPVPTAAPIQTLRMLSNSPVGGFGAMRTATTSVVRWVDRGRGNIYEISDNSQDIKTLSNTLVPRIYHSWWNKNLTAFIGQYLADNSDTITTVLANIVQSNATSAGSDDQVTETPYQLKGKLISGTVIAGAVSPAQDKLLFVTNESGRAIGYTSKFDGTGQAQIFSLPMTQINVDWPEANTVVISTKASASYAGYAYTLNLKTKEMKAVVSNAVGLTARVSKDAKKVFYSRTGSGTNRIVNTVLDIKTGKTSEVIFQALADKCVWSKKSPSIIYCAVASQLYDGIYPDDWYYGKMSFTDNIWILDTSNNQARQISDLLNEGDAIVDAVNLQLDPNDEYLYFMNKNDLSLWSLDLASTN